MVIPFNKGIITAIFAFLCFTLLFVSCFKTNSQAENNYIFKTLVNTNSEYTAQIISKSDTLTYSSHENNSGQIISELKIRASRLNALNITTTYILDTTVLDYRLLQHKKVQLLADSLTNSLTANEYNELSEKCFSLITAIFNQSNIRKKNIQSVFFHYAILKTKKRSLSSKDSITSTPHAGYILGRTYYWNQEDFMVNVRLIKDIFKSHPDLLSSSKNKQVYDYINSVTDSTISFDKIYEFSIHKDVYLKTLSNIVDRNKINYTKNIQTNGTKTTKASDCAWWCPLGCGSDWGCCGNYSGCCFYASLECYIHDRMCGDCTPRWFCFSGCVPD